MKKYAFYGESSPEVTPIDKIYQSILNQRDMYDILTNLWDIDTCAPRYRKEWSKENMTLGQCSITSFLIQDIFGGEVYGVPLPEGGYHCFNVVKDSLFDLTSEQFGNQKLLYTKDYPQYREKHFEDKEKYNRYLLLKEKLEKYLKENRSN